MRRNIQTLFVLGVLAGLSLSAWSSVPSLNLLQTITMNSTYGTLHGLSYENGLLWTASLYNYDEWQVLGVSPTTGVVSTAIPTPSIYYADIPGGVTSDGTSFYATVSSGTIMSVNTSNQAVQSIPAAGTGAPTGLAWDGTYLWEGTGSSINNLFRLDPTTGTVLGTYTVAGGVQGLAWDGRSLWVSTVSSGAAPDIYRYDRSGTMIEEFQAPSQLTHLGDIESDGTNLWAVDSQNQNLYKFATPAPQVAPPSYPTGVLSVSYQSYSQIQSGSKTYTDSQTASSYSQMPLASSLRYGNVTSGQCVSALARGFYDTAGKIHYALEALAENNGSTGVTGHGQVSYTQQDVISSAVAQLPNGTSINASGTMTVTGSWNVTRASATSGEGYSTLSLSLVLLRPGLPSDTIFTGGIGLSEPGVGGKWMYWQLDGQMANVAAAKSAATAGFSDNSTHTQAQLLISGLQIPYSLPVIVGETFTIEVEMDAVASVPSWVNGGAEVAMGEPLELQTSYLTSSQTTAPEPATLAILCLGALAIGRKRR